jgi:hypothetical protein
MGWLGVDREMLKSSTKGRRWGGAKIIGRETNQSIEWAVTQILRISTTRDGSPAYCVSYKNVFNEEGVQGDNYGDDEGYNNANRFGRRYRDSKKNNFIAGATSAKTLMHCELFINH